jgi:thiol peroxidase
MATVTFRGSPVHTNGDLPRVGQQAPGFALVSSALEDVRLSDFAGRWVLLNVFPSIDTSVCAESTRKFNAYAKSHPDVAFLMISADLPFAHQRFCSAEGLANVRTLSMMRSKDFARDYGLLLVDGPFAGITARAVLVIDPKGIVRHAELVSEIGHEPNYEAALGTLP